MKRSKSLRQRGVRLQNVLANFTPEQLAGIGAVMMTYNEAETVLHEMIGVCVDFPGDTHEVVSRINGTEGMIELVLLAGPLFGIDRNQISETLKAQGFSHLKGYRDAVSHARIYDAESGVARSPSRQGKRVDVLLSVPALNWLADQNSALTEEMRHLLDALKY